MVPAFQFIQPGVFVPGVDAAKRDEQQNRPEGGVGVRVFVQELKFGRGLVEPVDRVKADRDNHQADLCPHGVHVNSCVN